MRIDGKAIADGIFSSLEKKVLQLKTNGVTPTLAVILIGDNTESLAYIRQKQKATARIGGKFIFERLPKMTTHKKLIARIQMYNADPSVHALIVQRPVPGIPDASEIVNRVSINKDIDGFLPHSPFEVPIAAAVFIILQSIHVDVTAKHIVIIGRGETAGKPIAAAFAKRHCATSIIHSGTLNPKEITKHADILISCVGRENVVTPDMVKPGAIVLSVGIWSAADGKLHGDYVEDEIKDIAAFYTPTPGGVGPVNIACLMQNLVRAAKNLTH